MSSELVQLGDFRIVKQIGAGGMGIVYLAKQTSLNRLVALKVLGRSLSRPSDKARFRREAIAVARLKHPNIATVYFVGQDDSLCYMAMEYVEGVSLRQVIDRLANVTNISSLEDCLHVANVEPSMERFDVDSPTEDYAPPRSDTNPYRTPEAGKSITTKAHARRCCEIVRDAAMGLDHAHQQGVIHRDIKPANVMLSKDGSVHIIDFGVARFYDEETMTRTGALVGTPIYMSPEQVTGRIELDQRADIYSLGLVLYELLTLFQAFAAPTRNEVLRKIVTKPLFPVSWANSAIPISVQNVVHKAAAKDPDDRYPSAKEFADDLQRILDGTQVLAPPYRYRLDESEVRAARPGSVIVAACIAFAKALIGGGMAIEGIARLIRFDDTPSGITLSTIVGPLALVWFLVATWGLLRGRAFAWWQLVLSCVGLVGLWSYLWLGEAGNCWNMLNANLPSLGSYLFRMLCFATPSVVCLILLFSKSTWNWFRYVRRMRMEHKNTIGRARGA
jgi:serine/threonine protein kinase